MSEPRFFNQPRVKRWALLLGCCGLIWFGSFAVSKRIAARRLFVSSGDPEASCGPVSLAVVARWQGLEPTIDEINVLTQVGDSGVTSLRDLRDAAVALGLYARVVQFNPDPPFKSELPMILHVHGDHFVPAWPAGQERMVLADLPDIPRLIDDRWIGPPVWKGMALVVARSQADLDANLAKAGF